MADIHVKYQYPQSLEYDYESRLVRLNLDDEKEADLRVGNGFLITEPQSIKKDLKNPNGIFSSKYGQTLQDINPFADRYKCSCGHLKSRIYHGIKCQICGTRVRYVDDNFSFFGWIQLKSPYAIIHPNLFKSIQSYIGVTHFNNIIAYEYEIDEDGKLMDIDKPKDEPFKGIGISEFKRRFKEIMNYYYKNDNRKIAYFNDIMDNEDKIFIQSIPVYTTHLRPFSVNGESLFFEGTNASYNMMSKLAAMINRDELNMYRERTPKESLLYDLQIQYSLLYTELEKTISQKKGTIRSLFGGRYNFSARSVITSNPKLRIDQVTLSYYCLVELLQQTLINIIQKSYGCTYSYAYKMWYKAQLKIDPNVYSIIENMIKDQKEGIPILINRNPTLAYGSILQMYCVGINKSYTMGVPLRVLDMLAGDFDGDTLNILYMINDAFRRQCEMVFNPRRAMQISKNDGTFNQSVNIFKDTLINLNTLIHLSRSYYSKEQIEKIKKLQEIPLQE